MDSAFDWRSLLPENLHFDARNNISEGLCKPEIKIFFTLGLSNNRHENKSLKKIFFIYQHTVFSIHPYTHKQLK